MAYQVRLHARQHGWLSATGINTHLNMLPGTDSNPCLGLFFFISGGHLLSHAVTSIVPSAA